MMIDSCAYIGHYPFRKTPARTAAELVARMDALGIDCAVVSSVQGIYYRDMMDGNEELFGEIAPYRDRLIPAANANPVYPCAMEDLERCVKEEGCREIRFWPRQTDVSPDHDAYTALLRRCGELGVPAGFSVALEDVRGRHPLDIRTLVTPEELARAAMAAPRTDFVIHNAPGIAYAKALCALERPGRCWFDMGKLDSLYAATLEELIGTAGIDRVLFGSSAPLQYAEPQFVKLQAYADAYGIPQEELDKITFRNAQELYKIG
ncbi:MAG: amidohydrolase family protein [Clostridiales bacterium]|nr:amidohydrolase family protein [Clostridiales bacterium]